MAQKNWRSRPVPNIIMGVSQQSAEQRRDAQCEAQSDCLNDPIKGVWARAGFDIINFRSGVTKTKPWCHEIKRGATEHYLLVLNAGVLEAYDLNTGSLCTVANGLSDGYLNSASGVDDRDNFRSVTIDDYTFIANRSVSPAFTAAVTSTPPRDALVFFRAGNYLMTYTIAVSYNGTLYKWTYTTPDNSASANEQYITTTQLAATFYRALTGVPATSGGQEGSGTNNAGDPGGSGTGTVSVVTGASTHIGDLGFDVAINGNLLHIWRPSDNNDFQVYVSDGIGGTSLTSYKETVPSFGDLPVGGFEGMTFRVTGNGASGGSSYWVQFDTSTGLWLEVPAPNTSTTLDPAKMPHSIFNNATDSFQVAQFTWLTRNCGDGINSAVAPKFVGSYIQNLAFYQGRLIALGSGSLDCSKTNGEFDFFPATAQEVLDTDPISLTLATGEVSVVLEDSVSVDESLFVWGNLAQFRLNSGINAFTPTTVQFPQSSAYEYNPNCPFWQVQANVYFSYEPSDAEGSGFARFVNVAYQSGQLAGDTDITAHVPAYVPVGVYGISGSLQLGVFFARTDGDPDALYCYNFLQVQGQLEQSAWNRWQLPAGTILWQSVYKSSLYVLLQRADGLALLRTNLLTSATDPGYTDFLTRLDMRIAESELVSAVYSATTSNTTLTLPYNLQSGDGVPVVATRTTGAKARGIAWQIVSYSGNQIVVKGDCHAELMYVGLTISSMREESEFFIRTQTGALPTESLEVEEFALSVGRETRYTRLEATQYGTGGAAEPKVHEYFPVPLGSAFPIIGATPPNRAANVVLRCNTDAHNLTVKMINDSHLPSAWTAVDWRFRSVMRPLWMLSPYGGPVQ